MNPARVLLGGLAAGILLLASGVALGHGVLGPEYVRAFASHRAHPVSAATVIENTAVRLAYGFLVAFLYASLRPRFGPGPRTALLTAIFVWVAAFVPRYLELHEFGILEGWRLGVSVPWGLAELVLAALLAGWIYRERPATTTAAAR